METRGGAEDAGSMETRGGAEDAESMKQRTRCLDAVAGCAERKTQGRQAEAPPARSAVQRHSRRACHGDAAEEREESMDTRGGGEAASFELRRLDAGVDKSAFWKMALDSYYAEAHQRWTWKRQQMDNSKTKILSALREQCKRSCAYVAMATTLEPNLRIQWNKNVTLSVLHINELDDISRERLPTEKGKIKRLILMLQDEGVFEESQYIEILQGRLAKNNARRYKIMGYNTYHVDVPDDIRRALYQLRRRGPLLAVIGISLNYHNCKKSGLVYRFDPCQTVKDDKEVPVTHALVVVSFVLEAGMPCLECQESRGKNFGRDGFLMVDITSIRELYSFRIRLVNQ